MISTFNPSPCLTTPCNDVKFVGSYETALRRFQSQKSNSLAQKSATLIPYLHVCLICKVDTIYHKHNQIKTHHFQYTFMCSKMI